MLSSVASGFGWDDINKCVTCDIEVRNRWLKVSFFIKYISCLNLLFYIGILYRYFK